MSNESKDVDIANTAFYANNFTFYVAGTEVYIDFQRMSPRYDGVNMEPVYWVKEHSTVIVSISIFKQLIQLSSNQLKALEDKFGPITPPEFITNLTAEQQKAIEDAQKEQEKGKKNEKPSYLG